jgi:hypothetical protein
MRDLLTGSSTDVVEGEVRDPLVELQEKRQRLSDTTSSTEDGDLGVLQVCEHHA